ncbi:Pre-mRNA-splicing factor cef1 [Cryptotrichosporon argae]
MVRIIIKGGVWRNTEDEILKAAIAKYGKNQWARISSLLVRKTPKQCKARWYEWLDPSIKKVEWSKTEDEKLLHLAKLMPTQWRTIGPIVGRTATQCLERYQKLLDDAEAKENDELGLGAGDSLDGIPAEQDRARPGAGGLRPGEIDTDPETRAARPDPIDMDDDEKEMLSEARARLANTQGKKAKRKARERQLEEARRLAFLQKKRELKAAGINLRHTKKKKGMDYNADIPFEKQPAPGFYDVAEERSKVYAAPVGQSLRAAEGKRKQEIDEMEAQKKKKGNDGKATGGSATQFVAAREAQIKKLKAQEQSIRRRALDLPLPQVGERELEEIVKIGQAGEAARELVRGDGERATDGLVGEYEGLGQARMARTPRVAPQQDNVMTEARNLRTMYSVQTPLLGDENTPLRAANEQGTGYEGAAPRQFVAATPNPLATPAHRGGLAGPAATPRGLGATPMRTPMRDTLSINEATPAGWADASDDRRRAHDARRALKAGFAALPKPENNFELADVDEDEDAEDAEVEMTEEDAAERDARLKAAREEEARRELERRSTVVKKGLPRPINVNEAAVLRQLEADVDDAGILTAALREINREVAALMKHDSLAHPLPGTSTPGNTPSAYDMPDDAFVALARAAVHDELAGSLGLPGASDAQLALAIAAQADDDDDAFAHGWAAQRPALVFAPRHGWVDPALLSDAERAQTYARMVEASRERIVAEATRAAKAEKKLAKQLGGYQSINVRLRAEIVATIDDIHAARREIQTFEMLRTIEEAAAPARVEQKRQEVAQLERREADLQARYAELNDERRERTTAIEQLEEDKLVIQAQQALDAQQADGADADGDAEMA